MFRIPKHIGIIPDGNRRWAKKSGLKKEEGYAFGLEPGLALLRTAKKYGVRELTYYGFTVDNCKRPREQLKAFSRACVEAVKLMESEDVRPYVLGNTKSSCFPKELIPYTEPETSPGSDSDKMRVNLLVNYGWEWDMKHDWVSKMIPRVDLVIRWGGMCRLSGFLPLQTVYSDFCIIQELWPDFKEEQFEYALNWYQKQDVTLGG
ncbi:undecaprenyl diphosphate synthase family protein [Parablautia intestinalis]|uniref:undecaprenyl diphosphate synthase family protein n=1 Tax=Parablautia intestinalis TaxID=2320100 RepID=UPI00256F34EE|nr:undecaprenyl diphosphate synthase family protein [Parablautia intestinalis]